MFANLSTQAFTEDRDARLAEAQKKLEEATREFAELSSELGGEQANHFVRSFAFSNDSTKANKARLGINIGEVEIMESINGELKQSDSKVDGVKVLGVSPEGPADKVGLQSGDLITSLNGQVLLDNKEKSALTQLTDIMSKVAPGDVVTLMYQRDGVTQSTSLTTDEMPKANFKMLFGDKGLNFDGDIDIDIQGLEGLHELEGLEGLKGLEALEGLEIFEGLGEAFGNSKFIFISNNPLGDAELAELSPDLGEYFGAKSGLLVVKAPSDESMDLRDGDVIRKIDGREPKSVSDAMRILRSYESGDAVKLDILRKKRKRSLSLIIPEPHENKSKDLHWNFKENSNTDLPHKMKKRIKVIEGKETT